MDTFDIMIKVIPMLAAIALGYILVRGGLLKDTMVEGLKKLVVNITLPAGLFIAFIQVAFKAEYILIILAVFASCALLFLIAKLIAKIFLIKSKYFPFLITCFEVGMIGYGMFAAVFGVDAVADLGVLDIGSILFLFLVFVPMLINSNSGEKGWESTKKSLITALKTPPLWGMILGLICSLAGLGAYADTGAYMAVYNIFAFVSAPTAFLICLVIGSGLNISLKNIRLELITSVFKLALSVGFAFLIKYAVLIPLEATPRMVTALFTMYCLPSVFVTPVFMKNPSKQELGYVSNTLSIGSLLGVLSFIGIILLGL